MLARNRLWKLPDCSYLLSSPVCLAQVLSRDASSTISSNFGVLCPYWANSAHQTRYRECLCCISSFWPRPQYEHSLSIDQGTLHCFLSKSGRTSPAIWIMRICLYSSCLLIPISLPLLLPTCHVLSRDRLWKLQFFFAFHIRLVMPSLTLSRDPSSPRSYYKMRFDLQCLYWGNSSAHLTCQL